jgi:hypothetical protein
MFIATIAGCIERSLKIVKYPDIFEIIKPDPPTAEEAIEKVEKSRNFSFRIEPYKRVLDWKAEFITYMEIQPPLLILPSSKEDIWVCGKWFVLGLFESPWEVKFV